MHFAPASASRLNQVERWCATLIERRIRRGAHRSTHQLERAIDQYLDRYNTDPKPFVWTKPLVNFITGGLVGSALTLLLALLYPFDYRCESNCQWRSSLHRPVPG
jgi:hypothetical protein